MASCSAFATTGAEGSAPGTGVTAAGVAGPAEDNGARLGQPVSADSSRDALGSRPAAVAPVTAMGAAVRADTGCPHRACGVVAGKVSVDCVAAGAA